MVKYAKWKYIVIILAVIIGIIYSVPNLYGDTPSVQISNQFSGDDVDLSLLDKVKTVLQENNLKSTGQIYSNKQLKIKFKTVDEQLKAKDLIKQALGQNYTVAVNLVPATPTFFNKINAKPMFLGLDLRGGVHFLLEVDMKAALTKTLNKYATNIKNNLRKNTIRYGSIHTDNRGITITSRDKVVQDQILAQLKQSFSDLSVNVVDDNTLILSINAQVMQSIKEAAVKQNILILHNRVNELGVADPIIQQQGPDRIIVELPGIQDTARAKSILGRTASLEVHMVIDDPTMYSQALQGNLPANTELVVDTSTGNAKKLLLNSDVELTGDNINDAQPGFSQDGSPAVDVKLDSIGGAIFKELTKNNIGKRMAWVLVDNGVGQVVTAPSIPYEISGGATQISGAMNATQANDVALLLRSGALAAPMQIIEERTVGPSLGKENISKGFNSVIWGFIAIAIFMIIYYRIFGVISVISLAVNLLLLIAILSMLQATLTLPGIAAIALAIGMAIDSNVLINERVREELRMGHGPQVAIDAGYKHAWATIIDSNVTTLIAGLALLAFGSGPVKGFAIVHCLGILTSMFSAVLVSRSIVAFLYGNRRVNKLYI